MEKKGEILNQLAIISDLLENANLETKEKTVLFVLDKKEFDKMYGVIVKMTKVKSNTIDTTFSVKIGEIDFVFALSKD
jgi:CRP-like cAMP-binding protein